MQRKISEDVKIGSLVMPFQSVGKSPAADKTISGFDSANLNVKKIKTLIKWGIYDVDIASYIPLHAGSCVPRNYIKSHDH